MFHVSLTLPHQNATLVNRGPPRPSVLGTGPPSVLSLGLPSSLLREIALVPFAAAQ